MELVEVIRLRRWTIWFAAIVLLTGIVISLSAQHAVVHLNEAKVNAVIPLNILPPIAMFLAMIFATSAGLSLSRESETRALSWTKPLARAAVALRIMAVDAAAVVLVFAFALLVAIGVVITAHGTLVSGPGDFFAVVVLSVGVTLMWYALLELISASVPSVGRNIVGFIWPVAIFFSVINASVNGVLGMIVRVVNVFNPLAYLNGVSASAAASDSAFGSYWQSPLEVRAALVWVLAIAVASAAVALWTRREA